MMKLKLPITKCLVIILVPTVLLLSSCSGRHHSNSETKTEVVRDSDYSSSTRYDSSPSVEVTTKTEEVVHEDRDTGLFSILGDIIAFPFRLLGAIF